MPGNHLWNGMASKRRKKRRRASLSSLLLFLGVLSLMETQAAHHKHMIQFTTVGTGSSLLEYFIVDFLDDVQVFSFNKYNHQLIAKEAWISQVLGAKFIEDTWQKLVDHEKSFLWFLRKLMQNSTKSDMNHTVQLFILCEIERNNQLGNEIQIAVNGQDFCWLDEKYGDWFIMVPEAEPFKPILTSNLWTTQRKHYMQEYCIDTMKKILQHSSIKKNVPPEVTVSYHEAMDGITTLSCSATGFYPSSILLHWQKEEKKIVVGKESSSGLLPNADSTFYQRVFIELPPEETGTNYDCVVEHIELGTPKVYPVHVKSSKKRSRTLTLAILGVVILVLSSIASFIMWHKIKTEYHWNEVKFTAVSTDRSLLDFTGIAVIDDIQWISYYKLNHQIAVKVDWISDVLGTDFIEEMCHLIKSHERDAVSLIHFLTGNDTKTERNNTMQYILGCELDDDIKLNSKIRIGLDGETMIEFDEHQRHWVVQSPRAENLKPIVESLFWTNLRKRYVKQYCVDVVQKVIQNSTMKENRK